MEIVQLTAENIKRIQVVHIKPDGNMVVIGGQNAQGKSSVLDSIMYALGGAKALPAQPIRLGEESASVELDLGDIRVKRSFAAGGHSNIVVCNKDGLKYPSPQALLDSLVGKLSFDPLAFGRMDDAQQAETLRRLVGLDVSQFVAARNKAYDERTIVGRDVRSLEARLAAIAPPPPDTPDAEQSVASVIDEQRAAADTNAKNQTARDMAATARRGVDTARMLFASKAKEIAAQRERLAELERESAALEKRIDDAERAAEAAELAARKCIDVDLRTFADRINKVQETNALVRAKLQRAALQTELDAKRKVHDTLTDDIAKAEADKARAIAAAKFPVDGLSINDAGVVTYNGLPLSQASNAELLRVSVAIGLALNPKLRVLLVRDGSLLDEKNLALLAEMAQKADAQVWVERVGEGKEVSVVMQDGMVKS